MGPGILQRLPFEVRRRMLMSPRPQVNKASPGSRRWRPPPARRGHIAREIAPEVIVAHAAQIDVRAQRSTGTPMALLCSSA